MCLCVSLKLVKACLFSDQNSDKHSNRKIHKTNKTQWRLLIAAHCRRLRSKQPAASHAFIVSRLQPIVSQRWAAPQTKCIPYWTACKHEMVVKAALYLVSPMKQYFEQYFWRWTDSEQTTRPVLTVITQSQQAECRCCSTHLFYLTESIATQTHWADRKLRWRLCVNLASADRPKTGATQT